MKTCAVKTVKDSTNKDLCVEFLTEAEAMAGLVAEHLVTLLGVVHTGPEGAMVLMELMEEGDLKKYLINRRPENEIDQSPLLSTPTTEVKRILLIYNFV